MKIKVLFLALLAMCVLGFTGCNDDDNYVPEDVVVNAFKTKYPDAQKIEWETKAGYKVADFILNSKEVEAWFDIDGSWVMTETDVLFAELPTAIQTAFIESSYGDWRVDDIDKLERDGTETVYVLEVERGNEEFDLYYAQDGVLIKAVADTEHKGYEPVVISGTILDEIKKMYPNAVFIELEKKGSYYEVDIRDGKIHKEVLFDKEDKWVSTEWDIRIADVPAVVTDAVKSSEYKDYRIDEVDALEKPEGMFYVFELESGNKEVYLTVKFDGTIISGK